MASLLERAYNPDVLTCLANLSSDEVFTPPSIANQMLDMLPQEIFESKTTTFLDPACKSGVFLREIAKRLLNAQLPGYVESVEIINEKKRNGITLDKADEFFEKDLQNTVDHIFHNQLFGIAITELTSLMSRRTVYCSKYPNSEFSISHFDNTEGNIRFKRIEHVWDKKGKCIFCGASEENYKRGDDLETHAYEWIHTLKPEEIFDMHFDVVISNPPYQLDTMGAGRQARPIYNLFVEQAIKLAPRFLTMIIPSRWFSGGMGLDGFRERMKTDNRIRKIVDYTNAKECFPSNSVSGGVCYFLWDRDSPGSCDFVNIVNGEQTEETRNLNEFPVLVRYNKAIDILRKVQTINEDKITEIASGLMPFGLSTNYRGQKLKDAKHPITLHASNGTTFISEKEFTKGVEYVNKYKVLISKTGAEHAGEPGKDGTFRVIPSSMKVIGQQEICTHSYFVVGRYQSQITAENLLSYLSTRFVRFLILLAMSGYGLSKQAMIFVPIQDFSKPWTDEELYAKYDLTDDEISFIESMIKPMDLSTGDDD